MNDTEILKQITELVNEEHQLIELDFRPWQMRR